MHHGVAIADALNPAADRRGDRLLVRHAIHRCRSVRASECLG
jgi:hypothetical protein